MMRGMNDGNLKPIRTASEAREKGRIGGLRSGVKRREKASLREAAELILSLDSVNLDAQRAMDQMGLDEDERTNAAAITATMVMRATMGDVKAYSALSKNLPKPKDEDAIEDGRRDIADFGLLLGPSFLDLHRDIHEHGHTDYWLRGGRGSLKSSTISLEIPKLIVDHPDAHAVVFRDVARTLRNSVYAQVKWAIERLGWADSFECTVSPMEMTYLPTGQKIYFLGLHTEDDRDKVKSFTPPFGYVAVTWYEEIDQISGGMGTVRWVNQSLSRGGEDFWRFYSFNPPRSANNWANEEADREEEGRLTHRSDFRTVPREWLGEQFIEDAAALKEINRSAWLHEYLGKAIGTGGEVFQNVRAEEITDEDIEGFKSIVNGEDWGYAVDPWVFERVAYDSKRKVVYIFAEDKGLRLSNEQTAERIKALLSDEGGTFSPRLPSNVVYADSAEPKSIDSHAELGINVYAASKWPNSVADGIKWLQSRAAIVIDRKRCPLAYQEFTSYAYATDKGGEPIEAYPDKDNHAIDAVRYALSPIISKRKEV